MADVILMPKNWQQKAKLMLVMLFVSSLVFVVLFTLLGSTNRKDIYSSAPKIQGKWLYQASSIKNFNLVSHTGQRFTQKSLLGKWHIVAFGYTQCPDICPTTLAQLSVLAELLKQDNKMHDLEFLFYSIDPDRDSLPLLANYIDYFSQYFTALRASSDQSYLNFEKQLGIKVKREVSADSPQNVAISHNLTLLVLNPKAQLQAVLLPEQQGIDGSMGYFSPKRLNTDFLKIRAYFEQQNEQIN